MVYAGSSASRWQADALDVDAFAVARRPTAGKLVI